jgi:hypothetical protein
MVLYKDMTAAERKAKYDDFAEAVEIHIQCFAIRPVRGRGNRHDAAAERHAAYCEREMGFIARVAKSCGDEWAKGV